MNSNKKLPVLQEFEVLRCCARVQFEPKHEAKVRQLLQQDIRWDHLIHLALHHGVFPLLHKNLSKYFKDQVPPEVMARLKRQQFTLSAYVLFMAEELGRLVGLLDANNIPCLALKGLVLAQVVYNNLILRSSGDVDLLIRPEDFADVEQLLAEDGYLPYEKVADLKGLRKKIYLWESRQFPFQRTDHVFSLDLHTGIMPPLYSLNLDFDTLMERSLPVTISGNPIPSVGFEDMLQILCYHGVKNRWETLKYVCDLSELVRVRDNLDWDVILKRAEATRGRRILYLGLFLAHEVLEAPVPDAVMQHVREDHYIPSLGRHLIDRLPHLVELGVTGFGERFRFHLLTQDTLVTKARYALYALVRRSSIA